MQIKNTSVMMHRGKRPRGSDENINRDILFKIEEKLHSADRGTLLRILSTLEDSKEAKECHFDKLPDEMVIKIIKMTINNLSTWFLQPRLTGRQDFLTNIIAKTSSRFRRLATDRSLWKGSVLMTLQSEGEKNLLIQSLNEGMANLSIYKEFCIYKISNKDNYILTPEDVQSIKSKCPQLKAFSSMIKAWPKLDSPWMTLTSLEVGLFNHDCLKDVDLSMDAPNLVVIRLTCGGILPDMSNCKELKCVTFSNGKFSFPGKIPLPKSLLSLAAQSGTGAKLDWDEATLRAHFDDCKIHL